MKFPRRNLLFDEYYYLWDYPFSMKEVLHSHLLYEIYYFHSGKVSYQIGEHVFELHPGSLIILNGLTPHGPIVDKKHEYVRTMFTFHPSIMQLVNEQALLLDPLQPFEVLKNHHVILQGEKKREFEESLNRINHLYGKQDLIALQRLLLCFFDMLMFIYDQCKDRLSRVESTRTNKEERVKAITALIENHYSENINLEYIEKKLYMNKSYLARIFRELTGMTIIDYLYKHRIQQAKLLLYRHGTISVTDVCQSVGFKHLPHFSRLFKQMVGMSPEQYRQYLQVNTSS